MKNFSLLICVLLAGAVSVLGQAAKESPKRMFAPYVDMGKFKGELRQAMKDSGAKYFTLAFVQSQGCAPAWQEGAPVATESSFAKQIEDVRRAGGDVIIAFGGYDGTDLAQACTDAASLQAAYQAVIDKYKARILDFDVEHFAIEDQASIDRRSEALKSLAAANAGLQINYTLPATPAGLTPAAMNVVTSATKFGAPVAVVNLMTMDYGKSVVNKDMQANAIAAATAAWQQLQTLGLKARLGITPMIGINDVREEIFTVANAKGVLAHAKANGDKIALLSFWSLGRDNGSCEGTVTPTCSGIAQKPWEFSREFRKFR